VSCSMRCADVAGWWLARQPAPTVCPIAPWPTEVLSSKSYANALQARHTLRVPCTSTPP
jgi:hypothetical protein